MNAILVSTSTDRDSWLIDRKAGIGSSDAPAIAGLSPYSGHTSHSVFLDKLGELPDKESTGYLAMGLRMEPLILQLAAEETGFKVERSGELLRHPDRPWQQCTLDSWVIEPAGPIPGEVKNVGSWNAKDWDSGIPDYVHIQVMHQMAVTGARASWIFALIGGNEFKAIRVERDEKLIEQLTAIESTFWHENVLKRVPPPLASGDCSIMDQLFGAAQPGRSIELDQTAEAAAQEYLAAKAALKAAEKEVDRIEANLKAAIGDAETAHAGAYRISWKNQSRTSIDSKALKQFHPLIAEQVSRVSSFRKFDVKELKNTEN